MGTETYEQLMEQAKKIKLLILDVDGILSDAKIYFTNDGEELKAFNTLDGFGIRLLIKSGIKVAIITGRKSEIVSKRGEDLGIYPVLQGRSDKLNALKEILTALDIEAENTAHMGDDLPDLSVMINVNLALTVPNAHSEVINFAHWQSQKLGGNGAVREACDLILKSQGKYTDIVQSYSNKKLEDI